MELVMMLWAVAMLLVLWVDGTNNMDSYNFIDWMLFIAAATFSFLLLFGGIA
jgi:hypothetical protein